MKPEKGSYTVVVLPEPASKPYRFHIRKRILKFLSVVVSIAIIINIGLIVHYGFLARGVGELKSLRKETSLQKQQLQTFASEMVHLKKQMVRLNEMDAKLRVIADIGPPSDTTGTLGVGGADLSGLFETDIGIRSNDLVQRMEEEVKILKAEAYKQELSLENLTESIKDRKLVWDSTPSVWPVRGWLSSGYGKRISPFTGRLAMHKGIDIATHRGKEIIAPAGGVVSYKGYDNSYGRIIKVDHGHGILTLYGHLSKSTVKTGQKIKRGDVIGFVGNTGMSTGPHLHYEVFVNGLPVNPLRYIIN